MHKGFSCVIVFKRVQIVYSSKKTHMLIGCRCLVTLRLAVESAMPGRYMEEEKLNGGKKK